MSHKISILAAAAAVSTAALVLLAGGAIAQEKTSYVGPSIGFSDGDTLYGVNAKFKVSDNISVRPFIQFANRSVGPVSASVTLYGASASYDFSLPSTDFSPYAGIGYLAATGSASFQGITYSATDSGIYFEVGTDYNISETIALNANYKFKDDGYFSFGGAYRF
ncbi:outer membrane beta-barrel protein [Chamaesiphon sp.]|uniref:outer membrane beta-barrel protein n=1 Tax=Chamaesiphon sp. TaxID=2814140 RepID=UPI0035944707